MDLSSYKNTSLLAPSQVLDSVLFNKCMVLTIIAMLLAGAAPGVQRDHSHDRLHASGLASMGNFSVFVLYRALFELVGGGGQSIVILELPQCCQVLLCFITALGSIKDC